MFLSLFGAIAAGIVIGAIIGAVLGALSPGMVEMFVGKERVGDAMKTGLALGLLNGAVYGFFGGAVIVIAGAIVARKRE
jgi:hypothetical protein